jgi:hypothetical protein
VPHGNPGQTSQAIAQIKLGLEALQKALPAIPMGTELHNAVIDAVKKIGAHMTEAAEGPQMQMQQLLHMVQQAKAAQPNQALAGIAGGQQPPQPPMLSPPPGPPGMQAAA